MCLPSTWHTIHGFPKWLVSQPASGRQRPLGTFLTPFPLWAEKPASGVSRKTDVSIGITSPAQAHRVGTGTMPGAESGN